MKRKNVAVSLGAEGGRGPLRADCEHPRNIDKAAAGGRPPRDLSLALLSAQKVSTQIAEKKYFLIEHQSTSIDSTVFVANKYCSSIFNLFIYRRRQLDALQIILDAYR